MAADPRRSGVLRYPSGDDGRSSWIVEITELSRSLEGILDNEFV